MPDFYNLTVKNLKKETPDSAVISFDVPQEILSYFNYKSGQYLSLKLMINKKEVVRDYSICSSSNEVLSIGVKEILNGYASSFLNNSVSVGDTIMVSSPRGKFVLDNESGKDLIGIAAGSGITPIMSMLKTTLFESSSRFHLVYSNKSPEQTMFHSKLIELKKTFPERLFINLVYTSVEIENHFFGRINDSNIFRLINVENLTDNKIYICGPEEMLLKVKTGLEKKNILEKNIFYELFKSSKVNQLISSENGDVEITYILDGFATKIKSRKEKTVLDAALDNDIDAPYSCNGGVCGSCIGKVTKGSVKMLKNTVLTDSELSDGLILACQAIPISDKVEIDFDDV